VGKNTNPEAPHYEIFSRVVRNGKEVTCYFFPVGSKYFTEHPILEQLQCVFVRQCEGASFMHVREQTICPSCSEQTSYILIARKDYIPGITARGFYCTQLELNMD
jgi:hypothetical protein